MSHSDRGDAQIFRIQPWVRSLVSFSAVILLASVALASSQSCPSPVTHLSMPKGEYSPQAGVVFSLQDFDANMVAVGKKSPLCYQRVTDIRHGEAIVSSQSLTREFDTKMAKSNGGIQDLKIETKDHDVTMTGTIKKVIPIHFTLDGPVSTDGQRLIFHVTKIKADGLPLEGFLNMIGKNLGTMLHSESVKGVVAEGDTLIFEPEQIAHVKGHIASADVTPNGLLIKFVDNAPVKQARK